MLKTFKYRIYPTRKQSTLLNQQLETCRWLYNHFLAERKTAWETEKKSLGYYDQMVNSFGIIAVEDLEINRMNHNHCLAKSISDAAWSIFFWMLLYKAAEAGRVFVRVNPAYTSQDCSRCGQRQLMPLSERIYICPCCHLKIDRDLNAALNILRLGLQSLGIHIGESVEALSL